MRTKARKRMVIKRFMRLAHHLFVRRPWDTWGNLNLARRSVGKVVPVEADAESRGPDPGKTSCRGLES
ncbi:hypothetical protein CLAIMM_00177 [Cladophialophora immunda]|nr:hypothetical protein CLAIMM_00177 [Cladophialophora immunda]